MRRLPLRSKNRFRALALELLEERNAPTPMSVSAIASPAFGVSGPEEKQQPFSVRLSGFSGSGSSSSSHANFGLNEPLPGGATPANHLQIAPGSSNAAFVQTAAAPAPQTFVGSAAISGPQLFDNLQHNPLDAFALQINQRSTGGIPDDAFASAGSAGGKAAGSIGGGAAAPASSGSAASGSGSTPASPALGGGGLGSSVSSPGPAPGSPSALALGGGSSAGSALASPANHSATLSTASPAPATPSLTAPASATSGTPSSAAPPLTPGVPPPITGHASTSALVPILYANTANDPAREVVQVLGGAQGGNPMTQGFSEAGVRFADGTIQLNTSDLVTPGFGNPWGQTRNWTNGPGYVAANINGTGWVDSQMPYIQQENNNNTMVLISSGTNARFFDGAGPTYTERYFLQDKLFDNTSAQEFELTDDTGKVLRLYDFSTGIPTAQQGTFKSLTDQFGNVTSVTSHTAGGQIQEVQSSNAVGSTTVTESYLYTYITSGVNAGLLQNVTLRRQVNGGAWSIVPLSKMSVTLAA
jgi:hypothetical protein